MRIAEFVNREGIETMVGAGAKCHSACAVIFMAGYLRFAEEEFYQLKRTLVDGGRLGFHAPRLNVREDAYNKDSVEFAYGIAVSQIGDLIGLAENSSLEIGLIKDMLKTKPSELFYIDTVDKLGKYKISYANDRLQKPAGREQYLNACNTHHAWFHATVEQRSPVRYAYKGIKDEWHVLELVTDYGHSGGVTHRCFVNKAGSLSIVPWHKGAQESDFIETRNWHFLPGSFVIGQAAVVMERAGAEKVLKEYRNRDARGQDIEILRKTSLANCKDACQSNWSCDGLTYDRWNRLCILKAEPVLLLINSKSSAWLRDSLQMSVRKAPPSFLQRSGRTFPDQPFDARTTRTFEQCAELCMADEHCIAVNFQASGRCELIDAASEYSPEANSTVGFKMHQ